MFKIIHAEFLAPGIKRFVIEAPRIARKQKPGQFVILRIYEEGERIPVTIENSDPERGTINIVVQAAGKTTHLLNSLNTGDSILDVVGPLGKPSEIANYGTVVVVGGGVGTAMAYPTAAAMKRAGNRVISIVGARNKELVILEPEMRAVSDALMITTDDGSYADKGFVTDKLRQLIENGTRIDLVVAVGPIVMMKAVAEMTRKENIHTVVSLNPIMIDGTGMCGGCRVMIDGKSEFACVDGPEFDAHKVDFAVLVQRNSMYRDAEQRSMAEFTNAPEECGGRRDAHACAATSRSTARRATMSPTAKKSANPLLPKERIKVPRQLMPEQPAEVRAHNFEEVNLGYSAELAQQEALRCLECAKPTCTDNCPVGIDVKEFVQRIVIGDFLGAAAKIREDNVLPAVTGRVCPQEDQCEGKCLLSKKVKPLGIGYLERFVADYEQRMGTHVVPNVRAHRKESCDRGQRALGTDCCRRSDPEGPQGARFRGAARDWRRAGLRHSGISPAQADRARADRLHARNGRGVRNRRGRGTHGDHRRTDGRRRLRRGVHRHRRGPAAVHEHSGRAFQRRVFGE